MKRRDRGRYSGTAALEAIRPHGQAFCGAAREAHWRTYPRTRHGVGARGARRRARCRRGRPAYPARGCGVLVAHSGRRWPGHGGAVGHCAPDDRHHARRDRADGDGPPRTPRVVDAQAPALPFVSGSDRRPARLLCGCRRCAQPGRRRTHPAGPAVGHAGRGWFPCPARRDPAQ